ncbi:hypothetical protein V5799_018523 [Amblyomma americanum]|uniref:Secreted protein n=1 Tax=Amblyomma americanum TaxID=6943 RepID=A0AAQ4EZ79_AMBAM
MLVSTAEAPQDYLLHCTMPAKTLRLILLLLRMSSAQLTSTQITALNVSKMHVYKPTVYISSHLLDCKLFTPLR